MIGKISMLAARWRRQRRRRRAERALADLPPALREDIGFPAVDLFLDGRTRFLR